MNNFEVTVLPDGTISVKSPGGFTREVHAEADAFIDLIKELAGGTVETKALKPNLGNPHAQQHSHGHHHSH